MYRRLRRACSYNEWVRVEQKALSRHLSWARSDECSCRSVVAPGLYSPPHTLSSCTARMTASSSQKESGSCVEPQTLPSRTDHSLFLSPAKVSKIFILKLSDQSFNPLEFRFNLYLIVHSLIHH